MSDNISSRPLVHELVEYLSPLVHWQTFGIHLPCITNSTIEQIEADHQVTERRKLALYARWLTEYSDATWDHVYDALKKERQHELASVLERKFLVSHSAKQPKVEEGKVEVKIDTADEIATQLVGLHNRFAQLETDIKCTLENTVNEAQKTILYIARYLERHLEDEQLILTDAKDIDDLFHKLRPYYSFLDCELLEKIVEQFVQGDAQTKLKEYVTDVEAFEELTTLQELKDAIEQALLPTQSVTPSTCEVILKVSKRWKKEKMKCLNKLLEHVFFDKSHLLKHIKITVGSMCIRFLVQKSQVEMLIALAVEHMEFMYLLGVFEMIINDIPVLMEDENENFTFDSALLDSSQSGNNEAVQFLLDLGVNVNYSNSEGKTALMLASEAGHEEIVRMLVLAEADVDLQDSAGETALMLANGNIGIVRCLLSANANLDIQQKDGNTALHIACYKGHNTVIELLLSYHASPVIKNTKDDTPFMASVRGNNADILKLMLDAIPSSHLSSGVVLACRLGHSAVFSLLVKQLECTPQIIDLFISCAKGDVRSVIQHITEFNIDPNTTLISGITPLMIASSCGHVEVIDTLIQMEADVNRIDTDNYSPLAYAITGNKSLPTVQYLLEAGANPHVLLGGITILERAYREEGQQDICDMLFKFSAVDLQKRFTHLLDRIEEGFDHLIDKEKDILLHVSQFLEVYPEITGCSKVHDSTDLFSRVRAYSDFLSYDMLVALTREFLQDEVNIQEEFEKYIIMTSRFEDLLKIEHFENVMSFLTQQDETTIATTTYLVFKLNRPWSNKTLKNIRSLCSNLFSVNQRYISHMTVHILEKVPCIKFLILNSTQIVEDLTSEVAKKRELVYLFGVFEIMIDNTPVLMEDEDKSFNFISALLESSQSGNNEAVQFLLDLGVNINYSNSKGKTALMLASEAGHEEVVQTLVAAEANVNLQDNTGETALILANGNIGIIHCLLLANTNLDIQRQDGNTALHIACYKGHNTVIELLLSYHASPVIKNTKDDTPFMASVRGNNADILKLMIDAIPSSYLPSEIVLACRLGHSAVFSLLVKQLECTPQVIDLFISCAEGDVGSVIQHIMEFNIDPNTTLISGITPLMIASSCGHVEVIDTLIQMEADVNRIDTDNYSPLAYAITGNKSLPTVQYLLEAGANPHVLLGGITILERACREEGQQDICDILFKFSAVDLQKRFTLLLNRVEEGFNVLIGKEKDILLHVSQFLEVYPEITGSSKVHDSTDLFSRVRAYSDFLSYELLVVITREFLKYNVEIQEELEEYLSIVQTVEESLKIENIMAFLPQREETTMATTKCLVFKLNRLWCNKTLKNIRSLCSFLFSDNQRYLSHMTVDIIEKVPCIKFLIPNSIQIIEDLISEVAKKRELMYLLGVFEMMVNDTPILVEDEDNFTFELAIQKAAQFGNNEAVQLLLDLSIVDRTHNETKAFPIASDLGHLSVDTTSLINKISNPNAQDDETGYLKLIRASGNGMYQMVEMLLKQGANPNIRNENGETALIFASLNGHYQVVEILLKKGADPNIHGNDGETALILASENGHQQVVELLLEKQVDPNVQNNKNGRTALYEASQNGHYQVVEVLLKSGADPNIQEVNGYSALLCASSNGHYQVVEILLKNGADPDIQAGNDEVTALLFASQKGYYQIVDILLEKLADPNIRDKYGRTALIVASRFGHQQVVELLLEKQVDLNLQNGINGRTALFQASQNGHYQVVEILLKDGADPNIHDNDGGTTLILASEKGHQQIVELLLEEQVDPNVQNSKNGRTALYEASQNGHYQVVEVLLKNGADPNIQEVNGYTALLCASSNGHYQVVEILLKKGADPDIHDHDGGTTLILASEKGHQQIVELLLEQNVDPNVQNSKNGRTALIQAIQNGHYQVVEVLLENGADPNIQEVNGYSALLCAISNGHYQVVEILLKNGADPDIHAGNDEVTALLFASQKGYYQIVDILLEKLADPNIRDKYGRTALIVASWFGHQQVVELLLEKQVDLNVQNGINRRTALFQASQNGHYQVVEILLKNGADPNIHDNDGGTTLILASENGHQQIVELLLEQNVDPNVQNSKNGRTALIQAIQNGHYQVVEVLLKNGADPNIQEVNGYTALLCASSNGHYQVVEILLKNGADPDIQAGNDEVTALLFASQKGYYQIVDILLEKLADPNIRDKYGRTALIVASWFGHQQVVELLLEKQVDLNVQNGINGRTALFQASQNGHYQVVEILLKKGADPNIHDNDGGTTLILASEKGHQQIVELLLEEQVDPNVQNSKNGRTALIQAIQNGHYQVVEILLKNGADSNIQEVNGYTALLHASSNGHYQVVEILLKNSADPNIHDNDRRTALILASENGHQQIVELLLEQQVDPNVQSSKNGKTALIKASANGHYQVVEILLKNGADPNIHDNDRRTALILASENGHQQIVELLLEQQVDPNVQNSKNGKTALIKASANGHYQVVEILLKNGADPNIQKEDGTTALIKAIENGHDDVIEMLLKNGADPNIQKEDGTTALIEANENDNDQVVEILLKNGADANIQKKDGTTVLIEASENDNDQVVEILLKNGADPNIHDNNGRTALMVASMEGHSNIIEVLLRYNANPHYFVTSEGVSFDSFACAAANGNIECLNIFLKHTKLSLKRLSIGWYCACYYGHAPIITLLSNRVHIVSDQTDLIISCAEGDLESVVDKLISGKITPDVQFAHGVTPLMISSSCGHNDIVEALITAGANVNKTDEFGRTALDFAEAAEQDATMNILLQHGGINGPGAESESHETTSEEQKLSTDTSQGTIKSSQNSLSIKTKNLNTKKRPFLMKKLRKDTVKYNQSIFNQLQHFNNREYSTTTHIP